MGSHHLYLLPWGLEGALRVSDDDDRNLPVTRQFWDCLRR